MRKLKEVLRLASLGLSQHQIARSCSISQSTVSEYLAAAQAAGVRWPLPADWDTLPRPQETPGATFVIPPEILRHRAVLSTPDGQAFSLVQETYTDQVLFRLAR